MLTVEHTSAVAEKRHFVVKELNKAAVIFERHYNLARTERRLSIAVPCGEVCDT